MSEIREETSSEMPTAPELHRRQIGIWLSLIALLIFTMVIVGGVTRLTDSGLSITEWDPIMGAIPPMSQEAWDEAFEKYKQIPEYTEINKGMDLEGFKTIFFWEWFHRLLGRFIGLAFAIPFLYFLFTKKIEPALKPKLAGIFVLGGAQGALGWYMVMSGLVDRVDVSQYRLTAHLGVAVILFIACLWVAFDLLVKSEKEGALADSRLRKGAIAFTVLIFIQILLGGLVAGIDAGIGYNTWPLMDDAIIPAGVFGYSPWYLSFFEDLLTVQFDHRMVAYLATIFGVVLWFQARKAALTPRQAQVAHLLLIALVLQVILGILTLVFFVPLSLAAMHQGGALVVLGLGLYWIYLLSDRTVKPQMS
jgi:cytochrome c oxidase assembly protein subunit 15